MGSRGLSLCVPPLPPLAPLPSRRFWGFWVREGRFGFQFGFQSAEAFKGQSGKERASLFPSFPTATHIIDTPPPHTPLPPPPPTCVKLPLPTAAMEPSRPSAPMAPSVTMLLLMSEKTEESCGSRRASMSRRRARATEAGSMAATCLGIT